MSRLSENTVFGYRDNVYLIGSNVSGDFVVGNIGADDDFFLIAARPPFESNYPIITGNFLDSEGNILFKLVQNVLVVNPGHCSKVKSDRIGYEIYDSDENLILRVRTEFKNLPGQTAELWVTTIEGRFYDKNGELVVEAYDELGFIETKIGCAMGFNGAGFAFTLGMSDDQTQLAGIALTNLGQVFVPLSGTHRNETLHLSGKVLMPDTVIEDCDVIVEDGKFFPMGNVRFANNRINVMGEAANLANFFGVKLESHTEPPKGETSE